MSTKVLVVGHSFVRRLWFAVRDRTDPALKRNLDLSDKVKVRYFGMGGATIDKLLDDLNGNHRLHAEVTNFPPSIVVLQVGGNDLDAGDFEPEDYKSKLQKLITTLTEEYGVHKVVICEIFGRIKFRTSNSEVYHEAKNKLNLDLYLQFFREENVDFWHHKNGLMCNDDLFLDDGVHLNTEGNVKFFKSLRGAVRKAIG